MAHFAQIDSDNIVLNVIVVADEDTADADGNEVDAIGEAFCTNLVGGTWKRTSYNGNYRVNYAGGAAGTVYDADRDAFIPPSPFPSWVLNEDMNGYDPPVPYPTEPGYVWDEDTTSWVEAG
jgi:hypothetical protein